MKVFSISGSIVRGNLEEIEKFAEVLDYEEQVVVVTGAGDLAEHIEALSSCANSGEQDLVGVKATRFNAQTLLTAMEDAYPAVPVTPEELQEAASTGKNIVMGGLTPGHSTDAVAAIAAELLDADLFIATTIDAVYDPHPEHEDAEKLEEVSVNQLFELVGDDVKPGSYELVDPTALKLIRRSDIRAKIFEGTVENISNVEKADGTVVHSNR